MKFQDYQEFDQQVPRYTSYPPATQFKNSNSLHDHFTWLQNSNHSKPDPISLYFHIPFCPERCLFCGCQTEVGKPGSLISNYFEMLQKEISLVFPLLNNQRPVTQIHFGGGTPNAVSFNHLRDILHKIKSYFLLSPHVEIALECDPSLLDFKKLENLHKMGFNRVSYGIQDFNETVLKAVHRRKPALPPASLVATSRDLGFSGINLDLIYGLPYQTLESVEETIEKTIQANPDRVSLFPYAHVPWIKEHQKQLEILPAPSAEDRFTMAQNLQGRLVAAGYIPIGMDHFVKPEDELAIALTTKQLHRNFQGYCSRKHTGQVYAFGASAISQLHEGYSQNYKSLSDYETKLSESKFPIEKYYNLTDLDRTTGHMIESLLCYFEVDLSSLSKPSLEQDYGSIVSYQSKFEKMISKGFIEIKNQQLRVLPPGIPLVRYIASLLDPLQKTTAVQPEKQSFSKIF